jgi:hypothetical protein
MSGKDARNAFWKSLCTEAEPNLRQAQEAF